MSTGSQNSCLTYPCEIANAGYRVKLTFHFSESSSAAERSDLEDTLRMWVNRFVLVHDGVRLQELSCCEGSTIATIGIFVAKSLAAGALGAMGTAFFRFLRRKIKTNSKSLIGTKSDNLTSIQITSLDKEIEEKEKDYRNAYNLPLMNSQPNEGDFPSFPLALANSKTCKLEFKITEDINPEEIKTSVYEAQYTNGNLKSTTYSTSTSYNDIDI